MRIGEEAKPVLLQFERALETALGEFHIGGQTLGRAGRRIAAQQHRLGRQHAVEGVEQLGQQQLHAGTIDLDHQQPAEAVDHRAREAVGLGMDQAIEGAVIEPVAKRGGPEEAVGQEARIDGCIDARGQEPAGDQRMRIEEGQTDGLAIGTEQAHDAARREGLGAGIHDDLIRVDPGMAEQEPAVGLGPKGDAAHGRSLSAPTLRGKVNREWKPCYRRLEIGWMNCGSMSQGKRIQVSWLTSVMKVSTRGRPAGLA